MSNTIQSTIRISGQPGTSFRIVPRSRGDEDVKDVASGKLDGAGAANLVLPFGYYVLLSEGHGAYPIHVDNDAEVIQVDLAPDK